MPGSSNLQISTDQSLLDVDLIINFLRQSYWAKNHTAAEIKNSIKNCLCFGLYENQKQIGFARVLTDYTFSAWLADVFILSDIQKTGYGQFLLKYILDFPELKNIKRWRLATEDAHKFYEKFGFSAIEKPEKLMEKINAQ